MLSQHALQVVSQHALQQGVPARGGSAPNGGCLLQGGLLWGGVCSWGGVWRPPKNQAATVADGTHPIGMHSCVGSFF